MNTPDRSADPMCEVPLFGPGPWFAVRLALLVALLATAGLVGESLWLEFVQPRELALWWEYGRTIPAPAALGLTAALALAGPWKPVEVPVRPRLPILVRAVQVALLVVCASVVLFALITPFALANETVTAVVALFATLTAYWDARLGWQRPSPRSTPGRVSRLSAWTGARMDAFWDGVDRLSDRLRGTR